MISTSALRYELKIPLATQYLAEIEMWIRLHPAQWRVAYPPRQVNSVYFDTATYQGLNANLGGITERAKLRLRWYGTPVAAISDANLELKRKQGMIGWKEIFPVESAWDLAAISWPAFCRALRAALSPAAHVWLDSFSYPVLLNHYRRCYYVTPDGAVRLTLDQDLHAYDQRACFCPNLRRPTQLSETVILELKADREQARRLSAVLKHFPARVDRFSKYVQGMTASTFQA